MPLVLSRVIVLVEGKEEEKAIIRHKRRLGIMALM
jgi:hypothetical protein